MRPVPPDEIASDLRRLISELDEIVWRPDALRDTARHVGFAQGIADMLLVKLGANTP